MVSDTFKKSKPMEKGIKGSEYRFLFNKKVKFSVQKIIFFSSFFSCSLTDD